MPVNYIITPGLLLEEICGEAYLIAAGEARRKLLPIRGLNDSAAFFFRLLEQGLDEEALLRRAVSHYGVPEEVIRPALQQFIDTLCRDGYLEEAPCH